MKTKWHLLPIAGVLLMLNVSSCTYLDQFKLDRLSTEVEFSPSLATPLAYGSFSIADVLAALDSTGFVDEYEDGLLYIYYTDTAYSVEASSLIDIPNRTTETRLEPTPSEILVWNSLPDGTTLSLTKTEEFDFQLEEGDQIDRIYLKEGDLSFSVFSEFRHEGSMRVTSDHVFDPDGNELDVTFPISELDGSYSLDDSIVNISGYYMIFNQVNDSAFASVDFTLTLTKSSNDILPGEESGITMDFENMLFDKIFGFIAQREVLNETQVIDVDLFGEDLVSEVNINFRNPRLNLQVHNSYGIPMIIELQDVFASSSANGVSTELVFKNDTMNPFKINAPSIDQLGSTVTTPWNLNSQTTNVADIIETAPDKFEFTVIAGTGETDDTGDQNFVLDSSKLTIEAEVELPMWLKTDGYELPPDTLLLEEALGLGDLSFVESASLRLYTTNEWPLQVEVQLYFLDANYDTIFSVFDDDLPLLRAADVVNEGEPNEGEIIESSVTEVMNEVDLSGEKLMELEDAMYIMFKAKAFTTDTGSKFVKFYSGYQLSYRVNLAADFIINPEELDFGLEE